MEQVDSSQLVVFALAGEAYALPIAHVHEIIRYTAPRSVASGDGNVCGVISLRGRIVPVYDLAGRLGVTVERESPDGAKIVIVEHEEALAGILVDDVEEVITLEDSAFEALPTAADRLVDKVAKVGERLIIVLRAEHVFGVAQEPVAPVAPVALAA
jgi:purine-binding chemotaxis protein CheW